MVSESTKASFRLAGREVPEGFKRSPKVQAYLDSLCGHPLREFDPEMEFHGQGQCGGDCAGCCDDAEFDDHREEKESYGSVVADHPLGFLLD